MKVKPIFCAFFLLFMDTLVGCVFGLQDDNANISGQVPLNGQSYLTGTQVKIASNSGNLVKTGFTFSGWNTKADGTGKAYAIEESLVIGSTDVNANSKFSFSENAGWIKLSGSTFKVRFEL